MPTSRMPGRRLEYKPHLIRWEDVKCEAGAGKHFIYPAADKMGRPIVMMRPRCAPGGEGGEGEVGGITWERGDVMECLMMPFFLCYSL